MTLLVQYRHVTQSHPMTPSVSTISILALVLVSGFDSPSQAANSKSDTAQSAPTAPRIEFVSTVHDFGQLTHGKVTRHDFVFTNTGTAVLEIQSVRPACGCTTISGWARQIEPGQTGTIPIQLNSTGFKGPISKNTYVTSNDPTQTNVVLVITGTVWRPFSVSAPSVVFVATQETQTNQTRVVKITSEIDEPLMLSQLRSTGEKYQAELKTVTPGKQFELHITALPPFDPSAPRATFTLRTSVPEVPVIRVTAQTTLVEPVVVTPNRITLPEGPLPQKRTRSVLVRNNGSDPLILEDADINLADVTVQVLETQPGRVFRINVEFPEAFELSAAAAIELTLRSNHPDYPLIRVPVETMKPPARRAPTGDPASQLSPTDSLPSQ
jgi:hypothetical protein